MGQENTTPTAENENEKPIETPDTEKGEDQDDGASTEANL